MNGRLYYARAWWVKPRLVGLLYVPEPRIEGRLWLDDGTSHPFRVNLDVSTMLEALGRGEEIQWFASNRLSDYAAISISAHMTRHECGEITIEARRLGRNSMVNL